MKKSTLRDSIKAEIIEILSEETAEDIKAKTDAQSELNKELEKTQDLMKEDEEEPSSKDLKAGKKDSISKISNKLQQTTKEMKSVVKKWKNADGSEKDKLTSRLKELTKIKKELEGLL
ncbi:MAG: hypothetical protein GY936_17720 [Ignavibacteriae bacterium]|nr:hypothetical protein [Candidatus Scalindua sp.]MCP5064282.1 hypothetical protein [Ignavibacteriota bacterium]